MQRCQYCGQLNDDFEEACIYCGEPLYIKVNHDDEYQYVDEDDDFAIQIARELLEEEENKNKRKPKSFDELDEFAKELLGSDTNIFSDEKETAFEEDEIIPDHNTDEEEKIPEPVIKDTQEEYSDDEIIDEEYIDEEEIFDDIEPYNQENIPLIIDDLKRKIKRNKKLEIRLGLSLKNIDLDINAITKKICITGRISINQLLEEKNLKISLIFFNNLNEQINQASTILTMDEIKCYYPFNIESNIKIADVATIIILPEITTESPSIVDEHDIETDKKSRTKDTQIGRKPRKEPIRNKSHLKTTNNTSNTPIKTNSIFIENMKEIERKIGLDITNTSILTKSENSIAIVGEIYIKNPDKYNSINIAATCYDDDNNIIATESSHINTKLYLGFDTLNIQINNIDIEKINRIRLYPTFQ